MDNNNNNKNLAASIKPPIKGLINNENKLNPEMGSKLKSPRTKQLPAFMNPTISASIKASGPKRKILGERNETLETLEQSSLEQSSFGSSVVDSNNGEPGLQPYDPVKNYLSPRPKYLRYNPDRRRKVLGLRENDVGRVSRVEISACFDAVEDSCSVQESVEDSCTERESVDEADDEECESEYEDEDDEFGDCEDGWFRLKGVFKFVLAVIAVILTAHAICLMKCPTESESLDWSGRVYGLNVSEVGYGPVMEPGFLKEDVFKTDEVFVHPDEAENDVSNVIEDESIEEFVEVQNVKTDEVFVHLDEAENDDSNVTEDESIEEFVEVKNAKDEAENDDSNVIEEAENDDLNVIQDEAVDDIIVNQDGVIEEEAADANDIEIANEMENELDDIKTNDSLIKFTTFDITVAVLIGHVLLLTSLGAVFVSRRKKVEKEEFKNIEPSTKAPSLEKEEQFVTKEASLLQNDIISHVHNIPSVELLGEFMFGEEVTSNISSMISSRMAMSTEDSHTVKKPRRKTAEVAAAPSPVSVRRSSRLKTRSSVMSP